MSMLEVKAVMSFGTYKAGRHYQVDGDDPAVQGLVLGGYFKVLNVLKEDPDDSGDSNGAGLVSDSRVVDGIQGPKKRGRPKKEVTDGTGSDFRAESNPVHLPENVAAGEQNGEANS